MLDQKDNCLIHIDFGTYRMYIDSHKESTDMDPNACLARIISAIDANDRDEFESAMEDLAKWLESGGFPPTCDGSIVGSKHGKIRTFINGGRVPYSIMTTNHSDEVGLAYQFVCWNHDGSKRRTFDLIVPSHSAAVGGQS